MEKILISQCLTGDNCNYKGKNSFQSFYEKYKVKYEFVLVCPEVLGGLSIPRLPAEINGNRVVNIIGEDVTANFVSGTDICINLVKDFNIKYAILKSKSPSCGLNYIYDGTHTKTLINGNGILVRELLKIDVAIYDEFNAEELFVKLKQAI